jgi:FkbM family methyltransferase
MKFYTGTIQKILSKNSLAVSLAIKLMNQCRMIVGYHLAPTCNPTENGEQQILEISAQNIKTFIDVGANIGDWTYSLIKSTPLGTELKGLLVEPTTDLAQVLQNRFKDFDGVQVEECALGSESKVANFFISKTCSEHSSLVVQNISEAQQIKVKVKTLDYLIDFYGITEVDFLKIDTEGNDFNVLIGAKQALHNHMIHAIQFEYGSGWRLAGNTLFSAFRYLENYGYSCYLITPNGLCEYDLEKYGELFLYSNFLALSEKGRLWFSALL